LFKCVLFEQRKTIFFFVVVQPEPSLPSFAIEIKYVLHSIYYGNENAASSVGNVDVSSVIVSVFILVPLFIPR
jgi:hypothetical protein